jgi:hypothetical protein
MKIRLELVLENTIDNGNISSLIVELVQFLYIQNNIAIFKIIRFRVVFDIIEDPGYHRLTRSIVIYASGKE